MVFLLINKSKLALNILDYFFMFYICGCYKIVTKNVLLKVCVFRLLLKFIAEQLVLPLIIQVKSIIIPV